MGEIRKTTIATKAFNFLVKRPNPKEVTWINFAVTYKCNGRCIMCSIWKKYKENPESLKYELSLSKIEEVIQSRYLQDLQGIGITGGEPFLRRDIVDLVGLFIKQYPNAFIGVATNGLNPKLIVNKTGEILDTYKPKQRFSISISLDGIGKTHDGMRGISNAYEKVMDTINSLLEWVDINLGLDFTVTPQNYKDLPKVYELSKNLGIKLLVVFAHTSNSYYDNVSTTFNWEEERLEEAELIIREIMKDRIKNESLITKLIDPYDYFMCNCTRYQKSGERLFRCHSGTHSLFLNPYGDVYPCIISNKKIGNVRGEDFDKLWMSPRAEEVREHIRSDKCHCWVACEAVPSLLRGLGVVRWNITSKFLRRMR